jgi:hypothetical protein
MADDRSDRLALPLMHAGQAQKEIVHNEALVLLDMVVQGGAESADVSAPPVSPSAGRCWVVGAAATGLWAGHEGEVAGWTAGGWRFVAPVAGMRLWLADRGHAIVHDGALWTSEACRPEGLYIDGDRVVSPRQAPIADPSGGTTSDIEARAAIGAVLSALRAHGLIAST